MDIFDFVVGLYAIIAGLGITILMQTIGQMIEKRRHLRLYWVQTLWLVLILGAHISSWFAFWQFAGQERWTALGVILVLSVPMLLYLVSHLAAPDLENARDSDLRAYYFEHHRWMQGLLIASVVIGLVAQYVILERTTFTETDLARAVVIAVLVPGFISHEPRVHAAQALLLAVLMLGALSFIFAPIG